MADKTIDWDQDFLDSDPDADTGLVRLSGEYINTTREAVGERLIDEHIWDLTEASPQPLMGAHKKGSGRTYIQAAAPTLRPDGVTLLDTDDAGRLWFDTVNDQLNGWTGTAWQNLSAQGIGTILRWQNTAQYAVNEIVEYGGILLKAAADPPTLGVIPTEPEWKYFSFAIPANLQWQIGFTYAADDVVMYNEVFWVAVAPVNSSVPGAVGGEWTYLLIDTVSITDDAVTQAKIGPQAVGTDELEDGKVTTAKIADLNVTTGKINALAVTTAKIDADAVTTVKILDDNVTTAKILNDNITTAKILDLNVTEGKIAADAVTLAKLGLDAQDVILWRSDVTYNQNDIVNYGGVYYVCSDVGGSDVGVAPADGAGKWQRWAPVTYETVVDTASITAGRPNHIVFADTTVAAKVITLADGYLVSDRVTVVDTGGYGVALILTGLVGEIVPANVWKEYIWTGSVFAVYNDTGGTGPTDTSEVLDTTSGDIAANIPGSPSNGDSYEVWNTGTGNFHVTGLPDSITVGDGKGIRFKRVSGAWYYEDVIIDYRSGTFADGAYKKYKWAGGRMVYEVRKTSADNAPTTFTFPEAFSGEPSIAGTGYDVSTALRIFRVNTLSPTSAICALVDTGNSNQTSKWSALIQGRWN